MWAAQTLGCRHLSETLQGGSGSCQRRCLALSRKAFCSPDEYIPSGHVFMLQYVVLNDVPVRCLL